MKKRIIIAVLFAALTLAVLPYARQVEAGDDSLDGAIVMFLGSPKAMVNGTERDIDPSGAVVPMVQSGRTLVPVRFIAEALGLEVEYIEGSAQVILTAGDATRVVFTVGSNEMTVNGAARYIDSENKEVVATVQNDRTLLPVRALSESIGKQVYYDRGIIAIGDNVETIDTVGDKDKLDELVRRLNVLPVVGSSENYERLMSEAQNNYSLQNSKSAMPMAGGRGISVDMQMSESVSMNDAGAPMPTSAPVAQEASRGATDDEYSTTNVQVEGVDEADIIKTDGTYVYQVRSDQITITKVTPADQMKIMSNTTLENKASPLEVYIDGDKLIVLASMYPNYDDYYSYPRAQTMPLRRYFGTTVCYVYNVADRANPKLERTVEVEGDYVSSRKIGDIVYFVSSRYAYENILPLCKDTAVSADSTEIPYSDIKYFPGCNFNSFTTIASIDLSKPSQAFEKETFLGSGQNIYVSLENMYIATSIYKYDNSDATDNTEVYKFSLNKGDITYLAKQTVPGSILNQFSMDEYKGNFRIATTQRDKNWKPSNNLYILDSAMQNRGNITGIAPEEQIYSVRFVGDRGYIVTFKKVDPLFVIDLKDIDNPTILGKLKIPGYSDYIHPVDENHIIGFGKDTIELKSSWEPGETQAYYQGMKMALFDVSDVSNPKEKFVEVIGDRGTESSLLHNHKALLYSAEKNILAFPVQVAELSGSSKVDPNGFSPEYGTTSFVGAYVYDFSVERGFSLRGKITHITAEDELKSGYYYDWEKTIDRIIYVGNNLITTSAARIQAHNMDTVKFVGGVDFPSTGGGYSPKSVGGVIWEIIN